MAEIIDIESARANINRGIFDIERARQRRTGGGEPPMNDQRIERLESDMTSVKAVLARMEPMLAGLDNFIKATLPHLATKAELEKKPGKGYMWAIVGVLTALTFAAVTLGANL